MPSPFMCHGCDTPTMNRSGVCDNCEDAYNEGSNEKLSTVIELEQRIDWLENGLKTIFNCGDQGNPSFMRAVAQATLDGEPTTADYFNKGDDIEYNYNSALKMVKKNNKIKEALVTQDTVYLTMGYKS